MSVHAIVVGPDEHELTEAVAGAGHEVTRVDIGSADALAEAGIADAEAYLLTEVAQATSISIVRERNPEVRVVVYDGDSLPDFARGQADLVLDPALFDPSAVAAALGE